MPYGWQFPWENVTIPSERYKRLNIWGMIDYRSNYHGFTSMESMTSEKIADFLDKFSLTIKRETFIVLDNAKVHRSKLMKEMRKIWEKRGLFLFFLPPYSPSSQHSGNSLANAERPVDTTIRLRLGRQPLLCCQPGVGRVGDCQSHQLYYESLICSFIFLKYLFV